jgi:aminobenzoyl-glutamate transport protein
MNDPAATGGGSPRATRWLDAVEHLGNRLPDPASLFALGAVLVMVLSQVAVSLDWTVEKTLSRTLEEPVRDAAGEVLLDAQGAAITRPLLDPATALPVRELVSVPLRAVGLLTPEGIYWALRSMVKNFTDFPPLGVVLVAMLGIGLAEKSGFIGALLKATLLAVPPALLTPTVVFVGVMSSMGLDAGYVVLPPVAAALYQSVGRSPVVGIAAVFAGVAGGFGANLLPTSLDPLLANFTSAGAQLVAPGYTVAATANWWFMIASTVLLTGVGWAVTAIWVEPRFAGKPPEDGGATPRAATPGRADAGADQRLTATEKRALAAAGLVAAAVCAVFAVCALVPGAPLYGSDGAFPRWVRVIVPLIFIGFLVPGLVYGVAVGTIRSDRDATKIFADTMAGMGSYIVLAFFAAQFIAYFAHSGLGEMLAISGGRLLASVGLPAAGLMLGFIVVVFTGNLFIGSMSAKYAFFAPVFVPMFMQVGISPELTQVAYRIGDSVSNTITPLNPYVVILLVFLQRYMTRAGIGTLVALMLPYALAFAATWSLLLVLWMATGFELGPGGPLAFDPASLIGSRVP